ncbi:MAG: aminodeoxychorismate lyase [Candidatus Sedimenticola sp. 20ELBAFRAG]
MEQNRALFVLINGKPENRISALDRGLHYGDGLFETISVINSNPCLWQNHISRLLHGCARLNIPTPDPDQLLAECSSVSESNERCVVKIIMTRGEGGSGYLPPQSATPQRIVYSMPWPERPHSWWEKGVKTRICSTRLGSMPALAGMKHLNRLPQVMARAEWSDPDIAEGVMLDAHDRVIEGTMSNIFMCKDGSLYTPDLSENGVAGVMQGVVAEVANELNIPLHVTDITPDMLRQADGVFLTNSVIGIWPVNEVAGRMFDPLAIDQELVGKVMERGFSGHDQQL